MPQFASIILAAGLSSRMGQSKPLLPWINDKSLIQTAIETHYMAGVDVIFVITGYQRDAVEQHLADDPVTCLYNPDYATGEILSSLKVGLQACPEDIDAVFVSPVDLPNITYKTLQMLQKKWQPGHNIAPFYKKQRGHPILLDRTFWQPMLDLPADAFPRAVIQKNRDKLLRVEVYTDSVIMDMDTPEIYEREFEKAQLFDSPEFNPAKGAGIYVPDSFEEAFEMKKHLEKEREERIAQRKKGHNPDSE